MPADPDIRRDTCLIPRGAARPLAVALRRDARRMGMDANRLQAAVLLACQVHRHQQRSADGQPYVVHPLWVAWLVCRWGGATDDVLAALLHDTAEDGIAGPRATLNHIADLFGQAVAGRVAALTKNHGIADAEARAADHTDRLRHAARAFGSGVLAIRLADRLHNAVTSAHFDADRLQRLHLHTQHQVVPLARELHLSGLVAFLSGPPAQWHAVPVAGFVTAMLALQRPWLGMAGRAADEAVAGRGGYWPRLLAGVGG
jgi:(p)ppGpp synthase/HD superfamily hydrolase